MNKKISVILVSILVVCSMVIIVGSASADVSSVNITSPTATNKVYVKSGGTVNVVFTITGTAEDTGSYTVTIGQTESPIGTIKIGRAHV
jgi:hypothetical protein